MASGASTYLTGKLLQLTFNAVSYAGQSTVYLKLHTGPPGVAGTANAATETTRQPMTFAAESGGSVVNDDDASWASVAATEVFSALSIWDHVSAGNCLGYLDLEVARAATAGDTVDLAAGDLTWTLS